LSYQIPEGPNQKNKIKNKSQKCICIQVNTQNEGPYKISQARNNNQKKNQKNSLNTTSIVWRFSEMEQRQSNLTCFHFALFVG
jgi:hypothetical protein